MEGSELNHFDFADLKITREICTKFDAIIREYGNEKFSESMLATIQIMSGMIIADLKSRGLAFEANLDPYFNAIALRVFGLGERNGK
jgi:hypothetical protein